MLTPAYIREATKAVKDERTSVALQYSREAYFPLVDDVVSKCGTQAMEALVMAELVNLNIMLNLARPMSEAMIRATAPLVVQHILDDDCGVTLADLRVIFDRAKVGRYGQYFGGIGSADVIGWIDAYIAVKCEEIERWHQQAYSVKPDGRRGGGEQSFRELCRQDMHDYQLQKMQGNE
jgi:hypothetical protein